MTAEDLPQQEPEELFDHIKENGQELSDGDLESVAGGRKREQRQNLGKPKDKRLRWDKNWGEDG